VSSRSVEVQTDLTWPCAAKQPVPVAHVMKQVSSAKSATTEDVGSQMETEDKSHRGDRGRDKPSPPRLNRPPPSSTQPVTDTNRYAVLAPSQGEEGESSSSVIK